MNSREDHPILDHSLSVRFARWLCSWRGARRMLIICVWVVTVIALLYGEENWRGRWAWNHYRRQLEAKGEDLDLKAYFPKPIPDDQNFAATPFVKSWFDKRSSEGVDRLWPDNYAAASREIPSSSGKNRGSRQNIDLAAWQKTFEMIRSKGSAMPTNSESAPAGTESRVKAASMVLEELKPDAPIFAELREASRRPYSRYPVNYEVENPWAILLPHLSKLRDTCQRLELKACAELAVGNREAAFADVELMLCLTDSTKGEPFVISQLQRIACLQLSIQPIWEGLAEHHWAEAQLQSFEKSLEKYDFPGEFNRPLQTEQAAAILTVDLVRRIGNLMSISGPDETGAVDPHVVNFFAQMAPSGWYSLEKVNYCRFLRELTDPAVDRMKGRFFPSQCDRAVLELDRALFGRGFAAIIHHQITARMLLPALGKLARKYAAGQTAANQAVLACALERCRLANGGFPEQLGVLPPRFVDRLPADTLTGGPYKYRRTDNDHFVLYSVGWNEQDDGGVAGKVLFDDAKGDWVW